MEQKYFLSKKVLENTLIKKIGNFNYFTLKKTLNNFINLKEYKILKLIKIKQIGKRILIHI